MPIRAHAAGVPHARQPPEGLFHDDVSALSTLQRACASSLSTGLQLQQEAYLAEHPEVKAMLEIFVSKVAKLKPINGVGVMELAATHFTRPAEQLDMEVREHLKLPPTGPYYNGKKSYSFPDSRLRLLVQSALESQGPPPAPAPQPSAPSRPSTVSSPFSSICTSHTTLPTPEPVPTPERTLSEDLLGLVSLTVDRAVFAHVDDDALLYDTVYVEVARAAEEAMEAPVAELREELAGMLHAAYHNCELELLEKERIARELEIASRMSKKCKKYLREIANFRGYAPPSSTAQVTPREPCGLGEAAAEAAARGRPRFNRYAKDRFGVWRSGADALPAGNATLTPHVSPGGSDTALPPAAAAAHGN